jgi:hypothetical protein
LARKGPPEEAIRELSRSRKVPDQLRRYWKEEWKRLHSELDEVDYQKKFCEYLHN